MQSRLAMASGKVVTALERDISAPAATTFVENVAQMLGLKASRVPPCATWLWSYVYSFQVPQDHIKHACPFETQVALSISHTFYPSMLQRFFIYVKDSLRLFIASTA